MKTIFYAILIALLGISCERGNKDSSTDLISSDTVKICSNHYFEIVKANDSLICFKKNGILTKSCLTDTLFICVNKTDSLLFVNNQIINLFSGKPVSSQSNASYKKHSKYCSSNDIIEIFPFTEEMLVVNNYTRSDICYQNPIRNHLGEDSIIWEHGIGSVIYHGFRGGLYNSGIFDTKNDIYKTNNNYVSFHVVEDVLIGFHYSNRFDSTYNYELSSNIYEAFIIEDSNLIKLKTDTGEHRSNYNEPHPFVNFVLSSSEVLGEMYMLGRYLYCIKKNEKWQLFDNQYNFPYNIPTLVCEATELDTIFELSFDKNTYLGTSAHGYFLFIPNWKGNKTFEFRNLIVSKYVAPAINPSKMYDHEYFIYSLDNRNHIINSNKNVNKPLKVIVSGNPLDSFNVGDKNILNPVPDTIFKYPIDTNP